MAKIYQLMICEKQIGDVHYYECDAIANAEQVAIDTTEPVEIWEAEEIKDVPYDALEWTLNREVERWMLKR